MRRPGNEAGFLESSQTRFQKESTEKLNKFAMFQEKNRLFDVILHRKPQTNS